MRTAEPARDSAHPGRMERCDKVMVGDPKVGMMNRPGSTTNLKASHSTLLSCVAPDTRSRYQTEGSLGITLREEQIPCLSLDHCRSDPARVNQGSLEDSDLSPLAKKEDNALGNASCT
jgi:hypothetical protein